MQTNKGFGLSITLSEAVFFDSFYANIESWRSVATHSFAFPIYDTAELHEIRISKRGEFLRRLVTAQSERDSP